MKTRLLVACATTLVMSGCTLSLSDHNPKPVALFGNAGTGSASIAGGNLTLTGSNLDYVTALSLTQTGGPNVELTPILTRTRSLLTAKIPAVLRLPGMLIVSTAANAQQVELASLDALSVDGTLTVAGATDMGFQKAVFTCMATAGFCSVTCPTGKKIISGGCSVSPSTVALSVNFPSADNQWTCRTVASANVEAYAICGRMAVTY